FSLWESRERLRWNFLQAVAGLDAVLLPVSSRPALSMEETYQTDILASLDILGFCRAISLLGLPAVALPIGRDRAGRPLGVQVVAAPFRDVAAAEVAHLIETLAEGGAACLW
ncbi:MAG: amidase family protein, partial [Acidimicrobiales bacterium]